MTTTDLIKLLKVIGNMPQITIGKFTKKAGKWDLTGSEKDEPEKTKAKSRRYKRQWVHIRNLNTSIIHMLTMKQGLIWDTWEDAEGNPQGRNYEVINFLSKYAGKKWGRRIV